MIPLGAKRCSNRTKRTTLAMGTAGEHASRCAAVMGLKYHRLWGSIRHGHPCHHVSPPDGIAVSALCMSCEAMAWFLDRTRTNCM